MSNLLQIYTRPDQARPDQARPDQARPDQARPAILSNYNIEPCMNCNDLLEAHNKPFAQAVYKQQLL